MDTVYCVNIAHGGVIRNVRTRIISRIVSENVENRLAYPSRFFFLFSFFIGESNAEYAFVTH